MYDIFIVLFIVDGVYVPLFLDKMKNLRICFHSSYWRLGYNHYNNGRNWDGFIRKQVWQVGVLFEKFFNRYVKNLR